MSDQATRIRPGSEGNVSVTDATPSIELDDRGTVLTANVPATDLLGSEVAARPFTDLLWPGDREYWLASSKEGPSERFAGLFLFAPGAEQADPAMVVTSAVPGDGAARWRLTGHRPTPADLRTARVVRAARYEIVGRIASGVAHELNNILSTVTTFSDLLLARVGADASVREDLKEIKDAATEASHVLRKLDLFAGGRAKGPLSIHPRDVLTGMDKLLRRFVPEGIGIDVEVASDCPSVHVDALHLEEALFAVLAEARDDVVDGGRIAIGARPAPGDDPATDGAVHLTVSWDGSGGTNGADRGLGLGMNLVHRFAAAAGGRFRIERTVTGGVTARLEIPAHADAPAVTGD